MKKHLLLIDDDPDEWDFFNDAVDQMKVPCKCTYADGAIDGMQMLRFIEPDLIFLDINMSKINGFECLEQLKKEPSTQKIPVIIYSIGLNPALCKKALEAGATACVKKLASIPALTKTLEDIVTMQAPLSTLGEKYL
jgi:CheY-like chemotaxis protein